MTPAKTVKRIACQPLDTWNPVVFAETVSSIVLAFEQVPNPRRNCRVTISIKMLQKVNARWREFSGTAQACTRKMNIEKVNIALTILGAHIKIVEVAEDGSIVADV